MDEETKQRLLEELRKEYRVELKPLKEAKFSVKDIIDRYNEDMCNKLGVPNDWRYTDPLGNAIRKVVCTKYGANSLKDIKVSERDAFKEDTEKLIKEFILK